MFGSLCILTKELNCQPKKHNFLKQQWPTSFSFSVPFAAIDENGKRCKKISNVIMVAIAIDASTTPVVQYSLKITCFGNISFFLTMGLLSLNEGMWVLSKILCNKYCCSFLCSVPFAIQPAYFPVSNHVGLGLTFSLPVSSLIYNLKLFYVNV